MRTAADLFLHVLLFVLTVWKMEEKSREATSGQAYFNILL